MQYGTQGSQNTTIDLCYKYTSTYRCVLTTLYTILYFDTHNGNAAPQSIVKNIRILTDLFFLFRCCTKAGKYMLENA